MARTDATTIQAAGQEVRLSSPGKELFPAHGGRPAVTKLDLAEYYLLAADAVLLGVRERPTVLKRWVDGVTGEFFFQKRVPDSRPDWLQTATVTFPSGRTATELVPNDAAHLIWATNLANIDWNPWPVRRADLDHPDELRIDLDPSDGVGWETVREVALCVRDVLHDCGGMIGFPKTSGSRGIHIGVRIEPRWDFTEVRRAALALGREVERRLPGKATTKWWKEERVGVFIDYNQNARDRTVASAYSVRPVPDARVSCGLHWDEVPDCDAADFTLFTVPARLAEVGDPIAAIDDVVHDLFPLLELARLDEESGLGDAPWPPSFRKQAGEPKRVQPSRAKKAEPESE
jgi:DNA ligase D-like protein (predicted polymerase)